MDIMIGIDMGGTKIEALALAGDGRELYRERVPTPRAYRETLAAVGGLVSRAEAAAGGPASVGVGIPGIISGLTGLVKNANSTWLIGHALDRDLEALLDRPVRMSNDANCFALSEAVDGAGRGAGVVFGAILGTGVGGGIVVDGRVLTGAQGIAGEWGHNPMPGETGGRPCYCGRRGCVETWLSGPGLAADHREAGGRALDGPAIVAGAAAGDAACRGSLERYVDRLGRALAVVVNILDPDVVVLGGGLSNIPGLADAAEAALGPHVFTDAVTTPVRGNVHGDSSGVRGAAWLWQPPRAAQDST